MTHPLEERLDRIEGFLREIVDVLKHPAPTSAPLDFVALTKLTVPRVHAEILNENREPARVELIPTIVQTVRYQDGSGVVSARWTRNKGKYDVITEQQRVLEILYTWGCDGELIGQLGYRKNPHHCIVPPPINVIENTKWKGTPMSDLLDWIAGLRV